MTLDRSPLTIDGHADTAQRFLDQGWNFTDPLGSGHLNLAAAQAAGLSAEFLAIWVDPTEYPTHPSRRALALIEAVQQQVRLCGDRLALCRSSAELQQAHREGKFAILLSLEGGHAIEQDLGLLRLYHQQGIRYMTLTWSHSVGWADSCGDIADPTVPHAHGLTAFGHQVIAEMNRLGILVDVSHVSDATFSAVRSASRAPLIASHSSARALTPAPRNLTDNQLREIAASGGIVMVNFFPAFIHEPWRQAWNTFAPERSTAQHLAAGPYRAAGIPVPFAVSDAIDRTFSARIPKAPLASLLDHFDHVIRIAGIDHVGVGSDFDGIPALPQGLDSAADLPSLFAGLEDRGHSRQDLLKVRGQNLLRVMQAAEAIADR